MMRNLLVVVIAEFYFIQETFIFTGNKRNVQSECIMHMLLNIPLIAKYAIFPTTS